jgi:hypothetical protein
LRAGSEVTAGRGAGRATRADRSCFCLRLLNGFDFFVLLPPPVGDQFEQPEHRKFLGGAASDTWFSTLFDRPSDTTLAFQTHTDDIHLGLAETTDDIVLFTVCNDHVMEAGAGVYAENHTRWLDTFHTVAGLREDIYHGLDSSTPALNSGSTTEGLLSPRAGLIFGPRLDPGHLS